MSAIKQAREIVRAENGWLKSHGLGNDYIVFDSNNIGFELSEEKIIKICDRNYGIGSDGILLLVDSKSADYGLIIYNPDGSQAEKSGNGLRIFADYLYSMGYTSKLSFGIEVGKELVECRITLDESKEVDYISVDIGKATFVPEEVPVLCQKSEAIDFDMVLDEQKYFFSAVSVGNPHAVCVVENLGDIDIKKLGAMVETHPMFPNRTNVQFVQIIDRQNVQIEIWERGAGYTLASGSSSCGVVSVLYKKGMVDNKVNVHMPGGTLYVSLDDEFNIKLKGPVGRVACGILL